MTETRDRYAEARARSILNHVVDGIVAVDEAGRIQGINPAVSRIFGFTEEEVLGRPFTHFCAEPFASEYEEALRRYVAGGPPRLLGRTQELTGLRKDGSSFPMEMVVTESRVEDQRIFSAVLRDITDRKAVERMKNEFVSIVSHELRTPLTSLRGSLGLIENGVVGEIPEAALELVRIASANTERLIRLINDILDLEKMEAGKLELRPHELDAVELVQSSIHAVRGLASQGEVRVGMRIDGAPRLLGDRDRLIQVLTNLLSNAIKFSPAGSEVEVVVRAAANVRFEVRDSGPGIPPDQQPHLFRKFQQLDSSDSRSKGGTGLGLAISKMIVDQHGGTIGVESAPGQGSTFHFELPALPAATGPKRILLVEDDVTMARGLERLLGREGYLVEIAGTIREAEAALTRGLPDVLLLDLSLPDGRGLDLAGGLRKLAGGGDVPVIIVSADGPDHEDTQGAPLLAADWLRKPCTWDQVANAVRRALAD